MNSREMVTGNQSFRVQKSEFDTSRFFRDQQLSERIQISRDELGWVESYQRPTTPAEVVLNLSCGVQTVPHVMMAQVAVFEALGIDFVATAGTQFCCGRVFQRSSREGLGDKMAARSIKRLASWGATTNVQCCGSCLLEFQHHVGEMRDSGEAPFEVVHITQFLLDALRRLGDTVEWQDVRPRRVLLHAEGVALHQTKEDARLAVIETLELMPGVEFAGMVQDPSLGAPCVTQGPGRPSVLNDVTPAQRRLVQAELERQAREAGAEMILTHHHVCHREWSKFGSERLPVVHYQALMAEMLGVGVPDRFQALWGMGDSEKVLESTRPHWQSWGIDEDEARRAVRKFFVPAHAETIQRCPCETSCLAETGRAGQGTLCSRAEAAPAP